MGNYVGFNMRTHLKMTLYSPPYCHLYYIEGNLSPLGCRGMAWLWFDNQNSIYITGHPVDFGSVFALVVCTRDDTFVL